MRRIVALLLVAVLGMGMIGCGESAPPPAPPAPPAPPPAKMDDKKTDAPPAKTDAPPAKTDDTKK